MYRCLVIVARKLIKVKIKHFALTINSRLKCRFSAVFSSDGVDGVDSVDGVGACAEARVPRKSIVKEKRKRTNVLSLFYKASRRLMVCTSSTPVIVYPVP